MTTILSFMRDGECTAMQQLSKWWYNVNLPRIQMRVKITSIRTYDKAFFLMKESKVVYTYHWWSKKVFQTPIDSIKTVLPPGFNYVQNK